MQYYKFWVQRPLVVAVVYMALNVIASISNDRFLLTGCGFASVVWVGIAWHSFAVAEEGEGRLFSAFGNMKVRLGDYHFVLLTWFLGSILSSVWIVLFYILRINFA